MPSLFRRPLTPNTYYHLKKNYFFKTSGGKRFEDVRKSGNCLRCYSKNHRASACHVYTSPTPHHCRNCHFLFHDTDKCRYYDKQGKSRPSSANKSAWLDISPGKSNEKLKISYNFYSELYQNEADFVYFNDFDYEIDNENFSVHNIQISAYPASDKVKKSSVFRVMTPVKASLSIIGQITRKWQTFLESGRNYWHLMKLKYGHHQRNEM